MKTMYTHCHGNSIHLACSDGVKRREFMRAINTAYKIIKLIKKS